MYSINKEQNNFYKLLVCAVIVFFTVSPVWAALPTIVPPSGGGIGGAQVNDGDILAIIGAYFKLGLTMLAYILVGLSALVVIIGAMTRWRKYSAGQLELGDFKEYLVTGVILVVFVALLAKWGLDAMA